MSWMAERARFMHDRNSIIVDDAPPFNSKGLRAAATRLFFHPVRIPVYRSLVVGNPKAVATSCVERDLLTVAVRELGGPARGSAHFRWADREPEASVDALGTRRGLPPPDSCSTSARAFEDLAMTQVAAEAGAQSRAREPIPRLIRFPRRPM